MTPDTKTLRALADALPPGPWKRTHLNDDESFDIEAPDKKPYHTVIASDASRKAADFIIAARVAVPALCDALAAARAERDAHAARAEKAEANALGLLARLNETRAEANEARADVAALKARVAAFEAAVKRWAAAEAGFVGPLDAARATVALAEINAAEDALLGMIGEPK